MPISFADLLYRPIFDQLAVSAQLILDSGTYTIPAIDKTSGVALNQQEAVLETLTPTADLIMKDLTALGLTKADLDGEIIVLNGKTWHIVSHSVNPSPNGEADGTIALQLEGDSDD